VKAANVADYRELARRRIPKVLFDYVDGGSYSEATLLANSADFEAIRLRQRVLVDVSKVSTATEVLGQSLAMPMVLSPVGMAGMYARRGEVQAARAARKAGIPLCLSSMSICDVAEVTEGGGAPIWFQLYMLKDRGYMRELLQRAHALGSPVLAFTVDLPVPGTRYRDIRNGMADPPSLRQGLGRLRDGITHLPWVWDVWVHGRPHLFGNIAPAVPQAKSVEGFWPWVRGSMDNSLTWSHIDWIRENYPGKVILKGVQDVEDARQAVRSGLDGLIVSNHGGRQLDGAVSSISALPPIADAVGDDLALFMDGGVRSGLDVLKAVASGAQAVFLGRAWAYGLAARGEAGVSEVLSIMRGELATAMALTGCTDIRRAGRDLLVSDNGGNR
jgi:L-lactate dehydrogenase (cytochrome)